jgi:hypothetical protein
LLWMARRRLTPGRPLVFCPGIRWERCKEKARPIFCRQDQRRYKPSPCPR